MYEKTFKPEPTRFGLKVFYMYLYRKRKAASKIAIIT